MELYQLEYFRVIVASKNLKEASERLHVTQPSLSRCIKALEDEFGTPLFDRVGRNIELNGAGEVLLQYAGKTLDAAAYIHQAVDAYAREREKNLNLYLPVPLGQDAQVLGSFKQAHPDIHLRLGAAAPQSAQLVDEHPDLTFFSSALRHTDDNYLSLGEEAIVALVPSDSPYAQHDSVRLADLADESFALPLAVSLRTLFDAMFDAAGFKPRVFIENQVFVQNIEMVQLGYAVALAPAVTWSAAEHPGVKTLALSDIEAARTLYLKWPANVPLTAQAALMRDHLIEHFGRLGQTDPFFTPSDLCRQGGSSE